MFVTYFKLLFIHQGIISKRLELGDFILMGNWTITAVYGHQVCEHNVSCFTHEKENPQSLLRKIPMDSAASKYHGKVTYSLKSTI